MYKIQWGGMRVRAAALMGRLPVGQLLDPRTPDAALIELNLRHSSFAL